jgi:hypothetical protein
MRVEQVLREYGYALSSMADAPRDGRPIVAYSDRDGARIYFWEEAPARLAGPVWIERIGDERGYLDRYFRGWIDLSRLRPIDENGLHRLLIAYIDETRSKGDPMTILDDVADRQNANDR